MEVSVADQNQEVTKQQSVLAQDAALHTKNPSSVQNPFVPVQSSTFSQQSVSQVQPPVSDGKKK
jgi:hypothetical protein